MKPTTNYRQTACRLLAVLFFFLLLAPMAAGQDSQDTYRQNNLGVVDKIANDGGGDGESWKNPILIASAEELAYFAQQVNNNQPIALVNSSDSIKPGDNHFKGYYFALSADIDLEEHYWTPIGTKENPFHGNFDGNGHCVRGLKVKIEDSENDDVYAGLFGYAGYGTLRNLGIYLAKDGIWAQSPYGIVEAGGLAGRAGHIRNCYVTGEGGVEARGSMLSSAGGIVGCVKDLTHCYATVGVKATEAGSNYAGGIVAQCDNDEVRLAYTFATGTVEASGHTSGEDVAGGICGDMKGKLSNNLALNVSIKAEGRKCYRINGSGGSKTSLFANYASTKIKLNDSANITSDQFNGTDTWIETFRDDLRSGLGDTPNEWLSAWVWTQGDSDYLPKLKKVEGDENNFTYNTFFTGQPDIKITNVLTKSEDSPFILGAHITGHDPVYLAYDNDQWLRSIQGGVDTIPTLPFNGIVKGTGSGVLNPIIIKSLSDVSDASCVSDEAPILTFENVILSSDEKPCLTVNKDVKVILKMSSDKNSAVNNNKTAGIPVIANDGTLTITTKESSSLTVISTNNYAIKNSGTLILDGHGIDLIGRGPAIFNETNADAKAKANVIYNSPMVEWRFASGLSHKNIRWSNYSIELEGGHDNCRSLATTNVPSVGPLGLEVAADNSSSYITQQGCDDGGKYTTEFTARDGELTVYTDVKDYTPPAPAPDPDPIEPEPVPIYYNVYLPQIEGATLDPGPGEYEVESWNTFRFYLTLDSAYSESQPVVTTDRGETLEPRTSDGAYLVKYVRTDVEVFIDGLVQNPPPVANETIVPADALAPQIWAEGSMLCIRMAEALPATPIAIYTTDGRLYDRFASTPGVNRRQLPTGMYIVRVGETVRKVVVGR